MSQVLPASYFQQKDVVALARDLVGKKLITNFNHKITAGIITETEAYRGWGDKACHAHLNRKTKRTEIMYHPGGVAYVYLCYGIHHLFNIVTNTENHADAVLIRALEPAQGLQTMLERRGLSAVEPRVSSGPGNLSQAMGINTQHYGKPLEKSENIWLEKGIIIDYQNIISRKRVGISYAEEDADLPWRFYNKQSNYVSIR